MKISEKELIEIQKEIDENSLLYTGHHEYDDWVEALEQAEKEWDQHKQKRKEEINKAGGVFRYMLNKFKKKKK